MNLFQDSLDITELFLGHNHLSALSYWSLHKLTNLHILDLTYNYVHEVHITFSVFPNLQKVTLGNNNGVEIGPTFQNSSSIIKMCLKCNDISKLKPYSFCGTKSLGYLDLSQNKLLSVTEINGAFCDSSLIWLDLTFNMIDFFPHHGLSNLPSLQLLSLSHNRLSHIESYAFTSNTGLGILFLDFNNFDSFDLSIFIGVTRMSAVYVRYNPIFEIRQSEETSLHIHILAISQNQIRAFHENAFSNITVAMLLLFENNISNIDRVIFPANIIDL